MLTHLFHWSKAGAQRLARRGAVEDMPGARRCEFEQDSERQTSKQRDVDERTMRFRTGIFR